MRNAERASSIGVLFPCVCAVCCLRQPQTIPGFKVGPLFTHVITLITTMHLTVFWKRLTHCIVLLLLEKTHTPKNNNTNSFFHSFTDPSTQSFIISEIFDHYFVHSFIHSFIQSVTQSLIRSFIHSFADPSIQLFIQNVTVHYCIHSFIPLFGYSFIHRRSFIFLPSLHLFILLIH